MITKSQKITLTRCIEKSNEISRRIENLTPHKIVDGENVELAVEVTNIMLTLTGMVRDLGRDLP